MLCFLFFLLGGITACKDDENRWPDNEYPIPLDKNDSRYAEEPTLFMLQEQEGHLGRNKDTSYTLLYPSVHSSGFQEPLLPIRLPSKEIIRQALHWPQPLEDLNGLSVVFSGEVKSKKGGYYPIILTHIRVVLDVPMATHTDRCAK